jgi:WD40 repeat protein
MIDWSFTTDT